ncbi:hypothetical protein ACFWCW_36340, partial [Streptomyces sp. NPDC060054]
MKHTIVMTGASRGIGRVAAEHILRRSPDAQLLVVARGSSGAQLAAELGAGGHTVSHLSADHGSGRHTVSHLSADHGSGRHTV